MIKVCVINKEGTIIAEAAGTKEVNLPVSRTYEEGDRVVFLADETPAFYVFQADDALGEALVYVTGEVSYEIPFGEKKVCYSPKIFSGESHLITARKAREWEYESYRNLAVNVMDQHGDTNCYPHATANVETRGESVFAARNAIDGVTSNHSHGYWPYGSGGINRNPEATMRVDFGREVTTDRIEIYTRADFPHVPLALLQYQLLREASPLGQQRNERPGKLRYALDGFLPVLSADQTHLSDQFHHRKTLRALQSHPHLPEKSLRHHHAHEMYFGENPYHFAHTASQQAF